MLFCTFIVEFTLRSWKTEALIDTGQPLPWMLEGNPLYFIFSWTIGAYLAQWGECPVESARSNSQ